MAFSDQELLLYDNTIKIVYKDKAHRYFRHHANADGTWGKAISTKGVTTIMDNVLEKKGLMTWPMGLALRELFGFYNFKNEAGEQLVGFSKGVGTLWKDDGTIKLSKENAVDPLLSASQAWQRRKKSGADIGSIVHDAIEQYTLGKPFAITIERYKEGQDFQGFAEAEDQWYETAEKEVAMANAAFGKFKEWWELAKPKLLAAEFLMYSRDLEYCGTADNRMILDGRKIMTDYKTSNASTSKEAAAPEGVYYSYFIQLGAYAKAWYEMSGEMMDDLLVVSCRKDGGFAKIFASDLGLSVEDCIQWWCAVALCNRFTTITKKALLEKVKEAV